ERTGIIVHMLDILPTDNSDPVENYQTICGEMELYSEILANKQEVVVVNKIDQDPDGEYTKDIIDRLGVDKVYAISAATGQGIAELNEKLWRIVKGQDE
ncbi:MAG: hypothetical protein KAS23_02655, partial [Anaerohalosphaera sp.]|nr:hypothetical protein [Anaerohalosphaera sp.]